jgi:RND family efflux transporter MFP subunit
MRKLLLLLPLALLAACGKQEAPKKSGPPPALITTTQASLGEFEVIEETLGTLEVLADPKIGAEVAGRVERVLARTGKAVKTGELMAVIDAGNAALQHRADAAEAQRLEALAERQLTLVAKGFLSQSAGETATAQRDVARARADISRRNLDKTRVLAPIDGVVETQIVAPGDYVKVGDPLFQLVAPHRLRAHLPFPERAAERLKQGMAVRLTSPTAPGKVYESRIREIRPLVATGSRSLDVLVDLDNDGQLRGGGTVNAAVVLSARAEAVTAPEQSVVLRPAGKVVYVVAEADGKKVARQRVVTTGAKRGGKVEILSGLAGGETLALDGAGFLTDGAAVAIKQ